MFTSLILMAVGMCGLWKACNDMPQRWTDPGVFTYWVMGLSSLGVFYLGAVSLTI